jgi:uncharacterized OB-fold protein
MTESIPEFPQWSPKTLSEMISDFNSSISNGRLPYFECSACHHRFPFPRLECPKCRSKSISIRHSAGIGTIYSFTIVHRSSSPTTRTPYIVALVELTEGTKLYANVAYHDNVSIGSKVRVKFDDVSDGLENGRSKKPIFELM